MAVKLTAAYVANVTKPGLYCDAATAGLYLYVKDATRKYWVFRYSRNKRAHELGLGPAIGRAAPVTLADARAKATELKQALRAGRDVLAEKRATMVADIPVHTFEQAAQAYLKAHGGKWRSNRGNDYKAQWESSLRDYVSPVFGRLPVASVTKDHVMKVLRPIWDDKYPTARNIQNRVERILDYAIVHEWRMGPNPAKWLGNLKLLLPVHASNAKPHAAMPYADVPAFMRVLASDTSMPSYALQFLILTAARSGEVRGMTWSEIDNDIWMIGADRMKKGKEHRVPLSMPALSIAEEMRSIRRAQLVFPAGRGQPLSDVALAKVLKQHGAPYTVHGFRSSFRDWVGDETTAPREIAEAALAHAVGNEVEQAYRRGDALKKRRLLMAAWAEHCCG